MNPSRGAFRRSIPTVAERGFSRPSIPVTVFSLAHIITTRQMDAAIHEAFTAACRVFLERLGRRLIQNTMKLTRVKMDVDIPVTQELKAWLVENENMPSTITDLSIYAERAIKCLADGSLSSEKLLELTDDDMNSPSPEKLFNRNNDDGHHIRIKSPSEQYSDARYTAKSAKTGQPVFDPIYQRDVLTPSSAANARMGCLFKHLANRSGLVSNPLSEHEKALLDELVNEHDWAGKVSNEHFEKIPNAQVKALLDESGNSGGLEIAPIHFDADVISFPLLFGELFPLVDVRPVPRGRRIEGASIATPSMTWGGADNASIALFDTSSMVNAIDTTIFAIDGAVEIGRDFLSDSPVEVGSILTSLVGERLMEELDAVIADGNGSTQPEGLFQKAGVSTVTPDNTTTGPPTLEDYLELMFTVGKQYRRKNLNPCFVANDTTYQRSKAIKVDPQSSSTDQRPVMSPLTEVNDYMNLGWPFKVQNGLANGSAGFFCLKKFRMYRRLGLDMRFVDGGKELARKNLMLLVYRARYGGQLMDANAGAKWTNGQS